MTHHAIVRGEVCFRAGDGPLMTVPCGPVDIDMSEDSVTLGWITPDGSTGATAITCDEYQRYVRAGSIRIDE